MTKRIMGGKLDKPPGYYRCGISTGDIKRVMAGAGVLGVMQIASMLSDSIPPEVLARSAELHRGGKKSKSELASVLVSGLRDVVRIRLAKMVFDGKVRKHGEGKECKYEWITDEDAPARKNPAGRRHPKPRGTRPGRN